MLVWYLLKNATFHFDIDTDTYFITLYSSEKEDCALCLLGFMFIENFPSGPQVSADWSLNVCVCHSNLNHANPIIFLNIYVFQENPRDL